MLPASDVLLADKPVDDGSELRVEGDLALFEADGGAAVAGCFLFGAPFIEKRRKTMVRVVGESGEGCSDGKWARPRSKWGGGGALPGLATDKGIEWKSSLVLLGFAVSELVRAAAWHCIARRTEQGVPPKPFSTRLDLILFAPLSPSRPAYATPS